MAREKLIPKWHTMVLRFVGGGLAVFLLLGGLLVANCVHRDSTRQAVLNEMASRIEGHSGAAWNALSFHTQKMMVDQECAVLKFREGRILEFACKRGFRISVELDCDPNASDFLGYQDCPAPHIERVQESVAEQ